MPEFVRPAFTRIRTGLYERKHVARIGGWPMTLYGWLHTQVWFRGPNAGKTVEPYTHKRAAKALGVPESSVKTWFQTLRKWEYVTTEPVRYGLQVTIAKYGQGDTSTSPSAAEGDVHMSASRGQGDIHVSPSTFQGDIHTSPSPYDAGTQGYAHTSQGDISTSQPDTSISPSARTNKERARDSRDTRDTRESTPPPNPSPARARIVAYLRTIGRGEDAADWRNYQRLGEELAKRNVAPDDVAGCTGWLMGKPFYADQAMPPTLNEVAKRLAMWIKKGRPPEWVEPIREQTLDDIKSVADLAGARLKARRNGAPAITHDPRTTNRTPAGLRQLPDRHGTAHPQLPTPR